MRSFLRIYGMKFAKSFQHLVLKIERKSVIKDSKTYANKSFLLPLITMNVLNEFIDYVWDFYNPDSELYPIKGLTKPDIEDAIKVYQGRLFDAYFNNNEKYMWGAGDTLDRERVRDILLENPQFLL